MRTLLVGVVSSLVALVGFASTANASATIDLVWKGGTTDLTGSTSSDIITLEVRVTAGPSEFNLLGAALTVRWDTGKITFDSVNNNPQGTKGGPDLALPLSVGAPFYNGSNSVNNINSASLPPGSGTGLTAGSTHLFARVKFHKGLGDGVTTITPLITATDDVLLVGNINISATSSFNSATITQPAAVPEPGTVSLLALGLGGLALAGRRRS